MIHRVVGWIFGYVQFFVEGFGLERFVNLCRNNGIELWKIYQEEETGRLYANMRLNDFWNIRRIARKCRVAPRVIRRVGMPFLLQMMWFHLSFCMGIGIFFLCLFFLSGRIWGIEVAGQSYHTQDSILRYLETQDIYGGMPVKEVPCEKIEEMLRAYYPDIGWVSVKLSGSKIYLGIKEVRTKGEEKKEKTPAHLVAESSGTVVSIVTSSGTAKVRAGKKVKKGSVLISGKIPILDDNGETASKKKVRAEGTVVLRSREKYRDSLPVRHVVRRLTGRSKKIYQINLSGHSFFLHNPLNNLESYEKYDIIREGGLLCPFLSRRFPLGMYCQTLKEVEVLEQSYSEEEAQEILRGRFLYYLEQKRDAGYDIVPAELEISRQGGSYQAVAVLVQEKEQGQFREIKGTAKKQKKKE